MDVYNENRQEEGIKHLAIGKFKTLVGIKVIRFTLKKLPEGQYIYYLESFCVSCPI